MEKTFKDLLKDYEEILKEKDKNSQTKLIKKFISKHEELLKEIFQDKNDENEIKKNIILNKKHLLSLGLKNIRFKILHLKHIAKQETKETLEILKIFKPKNFKNKTEEDKIKIKEQLKDLFLITSMFTISAVPIPGSGFLIIYLNKLLKKMDIKNISTLEEINEIREKIQEEFLNRQNNLNNDNNNNKYKKKRKIKYKLS